MMIDNPVRVFSSKILLRNTLDCIVLQEMYNELNLSHEDEVPGKVIVDAGWYLVKDARELENAKAEKPANWRWST